MKEQNEKDHKSICEKIDTITTTLDTFITNADAKYTPVTKTKNLSASLRALWSVVSVIIVTAVAFLIYVSQTFLNHVSK